MTLPTEDSLAASLPEGFEARLAEEFDHLAEIIAEWNPEAAVSIAVALSDGSVYEYNARVSRSSASAAKPMWTAAALHTVGLTEVEPLAFDVLSLSDNSVAGEMIDLAGGVDAVNTWTWEVAELADTSLEAWRFDDPDRVSESYDPDDPMGNRTTAADLARFYVRLAQGELLGPDETTAMMGWLQDTSHSVDTPEDLDGLLFDRLPYWVAAPSLHKAGWLPPGCCAKEFRQVIDGGLVVLSGRGWYGLAIVITRGDFFDLSSQWVSLASCRVHAVVADDSGLVCEREQDGVHDPEIWPLPESEEEAEPEADTASGSGL